MVVGAVWGAEFIQFIAALVEENYEFILFSKLSL